VVFVMRREVNVLTKIERRKKRQKLRGESVCRIIEMNVEVTGHGQCHHSIERIRLPIRL